MTDGSIHFRILEDIANDLSGDVNFPTCLDAAILIRDTLRDPLVELNRVVLAVSMEPLIVSKLLRLVNSVAYNPCGERITDVESTIRRLGFEIVRTTSLAVAMDQMLKSRNLANYDGIARQTWENALQVAAISRVMARHVRRVLPDEAMLAGLVHNIGIFYLLYRAAEYPVYRENEAAMLELLRGWHEGIGESLLHILGLPTAITNAVRDQNQPRSNDEPRTVSDILLIAKQLADCRLEWLDEGSADTLLRNRYADLLQEAQDDIRELHASLAA